MDVNGKTAVVFGGASGIGLATAKMLAEKGAAVTAVSRAPFKTAAAPAGVAARACDARDEDAVAALLRDLAPYDILVACMTGGQRALGPFLDMDMAGYKASFDKLWAYANVVRHGAAHLNVGGSVTLVSGAPARNCKPGQVALSSVGGAVEALTRAVAREIAPERRINAVSPGLIDTPLSPLKGGERAAYYKRATQGHLLPRQGTAEECAHGLMFAIENDYVTGATVDVDGGWILGV